MSETTEATIKAKLDTLADFERAKAGIETQKQAAMNEIKVPAEVLDLQDEANRRTQNYEAASFQAIKKIQEECAAKLAEIVVPEEIREALVKIDRQRGLVQAYQTAKIEELREHATTKRNEIHAETQAATAQVYADLAQRRQDIDAEFAGKLDSAAANIEKLKKEIHADILAHGATVTGSKPGASGKIKRCVWNKGRAGTWDSGKLDGLALIMPAIKECRNPDGEPTVSWTEVPVKSAA